MIAVAVHADGTCHMIAIAVRMWMLSAGAGSSSASTASVNSQNGFGLLVLPVVIVVLLLLLLHIQLLVGIMEGGEGEFHATIAILGVQAATGVVGGRRWWLLLLRLLRVASQSAYRSLGQRGPTAGVQVKVVLLGPGRNSSTSRSCGGIAGSASPELSFLAACVLRQRQKA